MAEDKCLLCQRREESLWYYESATYLIMDCKTCQTPMVIHKDHKATVLFSENRVMEQALTRVAWAVYGEYGFYIDKFMKTCTDHIHWHARRVE